MPKIDMIYAWVAEDAGPDDEGIIAFMTGPGSWMPMIGADKARIESLRPLAQQSADSQGKKIKLLEFSVRRQVDEIQPTIEGVGDPDPGMLMTKFRPCQECGKNVLVPVDHDKGPETCKEHN